MANNALGALSSLASAPTTSFAGDPQAQQEYIDAMDKVVKSLESRNKINMFNVAGAFFNPGRTGSFGEGLGRASESIGKDIEAQQQQEPTIAMMRAQIAGQKYNLANDAKALQIMSDNLGMNPMQLQQLSQNPGGLNSSQLNKIQQLYPVVAQLSPGRAEMLKNMFTMGVESSKLGFQGNEQRTKAADIVIKNGPGALAYLSPEITAGMPGTEGAKQEAAPTGFGFQMPVTNGRISSPFGERTNPLDKTKTETHGGIDFAAPLGSPVQAVLPGVVKRVIPEAQSGGFGNKVEVQHPDGSISYYAHLQDANVKEGDKIGQGSTIGTVGSTGKSTGAHLEFGVLDKSGSPIDPSPLFSGNKSIEGKGVQVASLGNEGLENVPLGERAGIQKQRIEATDKPWYAKREEIQNYTPTVIKTSNANLSELDDIASKHANIFGLMQKQGLIAAMQNAAQEGVQGNVGAYSAHIGLPIKEFLKNNNLSPDERVAFNRATQILGQEFLNNVKTNRGLLGINPTDNDARLLQAPMATVDDSAKTVQYWVRQQMLTNYQRQELFSALRDHDKQSGKTSDPASFFDSPRYTGVLDTYINRRNQLQKMVGPTAQ